MSLFATLDASASGLTAELTRLDVIAENLASINTTRRADGQAGPPRRKRVIFEPRGGLNVTFPFEAYLADPPIRARRGEGVRIASIEEDDAPPILRFDPHHPDANADGYVAYPKIDMATEMVDMITASRAYEANLSSIRTFRQIWADALRLLG